MADKPVGEQLPSPMGSGCSLLVWSLALTCAAVLVIVVYHYTTPAPGPMPFDKKKWQEDTGQRYHMKVDLERLLRAQAGWTRDGIRELLGNVAVYDEPDGGFRVECPLESKYEGRTQDGPRHLTLRFDRNGKLVGFIDRGP